MGALETIIEYLSPVMMVLGWFATGVTGLFLVSFALREGIWRESSKKYTSGHGKPFIK